MHQKFTENANVFNVDIVIFDKLFSVTKSQFHTKSIIL